MELKIVLDEYEYECDDHCCSEYGTDITINGEEVGRCSGSPDSVLEMVLNHLKIKHSIEMEYSSNIEDDYDYGV